MCLGKILLFMVAAAYAQDFEGEPKLDKITVNSR